MMSDTSLIALLGFATLLPFIIASGTCYVKFSIVFIMVRNALGIQQVPNNMTLNGIALVLSLFVMKPIVQQIYTNWQTFEVDQTDARSISDFLETGLSEYKDYLIKYSDKELVVFFAKAELGRDQEQNQDYSDNQLTDNPSIFSLLPAYALSEIKSAFKIAFYIYLPFVIVDLLVSSILLSLGMMMMSPVTISIPIKLILFVALDGWTLLSRGLILQYIDLIS